MIASLLGVGPAANAAADKAASGPEVKSASALIVDGNNGEVIFEQKAGVVTPIASLTKLMTALVVLDGQQPLDEVIVITAADRWKGKGAFSHIPNGAKLTRGDLLRLALMASENLAARTLGAQLSRRLARVRQDDEREGQGARHDADALRRSLPGSRASTCRTRGTW